MCDPVDEGVLGLGRVTAQNDFGENAQRDFRRAARCDVQSGRCVQGGVRGGLRPEPVEQEAGAFLAGDEADVARGHTQQVAERGFVVLVQRGAVADVTAGKPPATAGRCRPVCARLGNLDEWQDHPRVYVVRVTFTVFDPRSFPVVVIT